MGNLKGMSALMFNLDIRPFILSKRRAQFVNDVQTQVEQNNVLIEVVPCEVFLDCSENVHTR